MKEIWDTRTNEELCAEYQETKNNDLFEYFLSRNYGLILKYIGPIINKHPEQRDELEQAGRLAMWSAMKKFNVEKGFKFSTYVQYWFRRNVRLHYASQQTVRIPINLLSKLDEVYEKAPYAIIQSESINKTIYSGDNGSDCTLEDTLASDEPSPFDIVRSKEQEEILLKLLSKLNPRENQCVQMYYGLNGYKPHTLQMIGEYYHVTRERIRQVIEKALGKIKRMCIREGYEEDDF